MNNLAQNINIFNEELVVSFLRKDYDDPDIKRWREKYDSMKLALNEIEVLSDHSSMLGKGESSPIHGFQVLQSSAFRSAKDLMKVRTRGLSSELPMMNQLQSPLMKGVDTWSSLKFETLEERIDSFLQYMNLDPVNQSQLLEQFKEWYFNEKPILPTNLLKRLFFGNQTQDGLLNHIMRCHEQVDTWGTGRILKFMLQLLDHSKCHQSPDFIELWRSLKPMEINESKFELIIRDTTKSQHREACYELLDAYLTGQVFQIDNLLKHDL